MLRPATPPALAPPTASAIDPPPTGSTSAPGWRVISRAGPAGTRNAPGSRAGCRCRGLRGARAGRARRGVPRRWNRSAGPTMPRRSRAPPEQLRGPDLAADRPRRAPASKTAKAAAIRSVSQSARPSSSATAPRRPGSARSSRPARRWSAAAGPFVRRSQGRARPHLRPHSRIKLLLERAGQIADRGLGRALGEGARPLGGASRPRTSACGTTRRRRPAALSGGAPASSSSSAAERCAAPRSTSVW